MTLLKHTNGSGNSNRAEAGRHGSTESSGAESLRSTDTVRGPFGSFGQQGGQKDGRPPVRVNTNKRLQYVYPGSDIIELLEVARKSLGPLDLFGSLCCVVLSYRVERMILDRKDSEVSPHTVKPAPANARGTIAPWEQQETPSAAAQLNNYRSDLSVLQNTGNIPTITQQPPSAISPWTTANEKGPAMATSIFAGSFYNDSNENLGQISPGFSPPDGMRFPTDDNRRPSVASGTTVSSTGSKSSFSGKYKKKLQGFFGEDYPVGDGSGSRQNSETSSMQGGVLPAFAPGGGSRNRNNSMNDAMLRSGPPSPTSSRPRTPAAGPSSEVTPWVYQDSQVSALFRFNVHSRFQARPARA
ncbi:hypothetical protein LTR97_002586 [Elasticomyces elasticus]|uniref:Uncharacterized protein n=1 Tax=Elasticomyces elasticus TaxID=574655 RepID=A0AAN7WBQ0_9PEZI|nr:hypothetical protein LTR97_002586 [Elasticomyces elasticus]